MVMHDNEFETKEIKIWTRDKIEPQHVQVEAYNNVFMTDLHFVEKVRRTISKIIQLNLYVNPLTPMSDQDRISPNNINTISTR